MTYADVVLLLAMYVLFVAVVFAADVYHRVQQQIL
jgi:hypothetical protein